MRPCSSPMRPRDSSRYRAPDRHPRRPAARVGTVDRAGRARSPSGPARFGFDLVITPIFEHLEVFQRVGESTDVVRKEMYDFEDKGGRRIALRPEGTARRGARVRAAPARWCRGRSGTSRRTSATSGRRRVATASTGRWAPRCSASTTPSSTSRSSRSPHGFYRALGLRDVTLSINSMGDEADRAAYVGVLREYLLAHAGALGDDVPRAGRGQPAARARLEGPRLAGRHRARAADHRAPRRRGADALRGGAARPRPRSASPTRSTRGSCAGFDYYTSTTFEFSSQALDAAQNAHRRRRSLRQARRGDGRASPRRASGSASASSGCSSPARPRASIPGRAPVADVFVVDGHGQPDRGHVAGHRAPRGRHARRTHLR